ncbi:alpha/beta fold hydrolase [Nocardia sp. NPDC051570]|uniref:alpha/beta fold hydrolase n=1 Tax=Nocardia sp. NPDC051570 TaxID=3364324 RepID=UPI0037ACD918
MRVLCDDGVGLHVEFDGDPDAPVAIVFVNGINTGLVYWSRQRNTLGDLGTTVLFDHRGHGRSDEPESGHATVARLARDIATVLESAVPGRPVVVVAHSMGGMAVSALAECRPDLFGTRIIGVALLDTVPGRWADIALRLPSVVTRRVVGLLWRVVPPLRRLLTDTSTRRHPVPGARHPRTSNERLSRLAGVRRARRLITSARTLTLLALIADAAVCDHSPGLAALGAVPVLVVAGDDDRFIPLRHKTRAADRIPGARLVIVPGAGHLSSIKKPDKVDRHLRAFITGLSP